MHVVSTIIIYLATVSGRDSNGEYMNCAYVLCLQYKYVCVMLLIAFPSRKRKKGILLVNILYL